MRDMQNFPITRPAIVGTGASPAVAVGNAAQLGTGPAASLAGSNMAFEVTLTTGTGPSAFAANTPVTLFTVTAPAGLFQAAPFCSIDSSNQAMAQLEGGALTAGTQALVLYYDRAASSATSLVFKAVSGSGGTPTFAASTAYKALITVVG